MKLPYISTICALSDRFTMFLAPSGTRSRPPPHTHTPHPPIQPPTHSSSHQTTHPPTHNSNHPSPLHSTPSHPLLPTHHSIIIVPHPAHHLHSISTTPHLSTSLHSTPPHPTPLHSTPLHSTPHHTTPHHTTPHHRTTAPPHNTTHHNHSRGNTWCACVRGCVCERVRVRVRVSIYCAKVFVCLCVSVCCERVCVCFCACFVSDDLWRGSMERETRGHGDVAAAGVGRSSRCCRSSSSIRWSTFSCSSSSSSPGFARAVHRQSAGHFSCAQRGTHRSNCAENCSWRRRPCYQQR